eukprot:scaffold10356_cov118-Isochrysis_galbana.AAC.11
MSPATPAAAEARTMGTTVACTGKQRRTPIRSTAASRRGSRARARIGGVCSPMMRALADRIHGGSSDSSVTPSEATGAAERGPVLRASAGGASLAAGSPS